MLYALATPNSSFKPSIRKMKNSWRLKKFKQLYIEKGGLSNPPSDVSFTESASSDTSPSLPSLPASSSAAASHSYTPSSSSSHRIHI
ncbi:hypothetical protein KGF57_005211 [Candida theae]|uniref:Uncharacterized protein n=1 Tax=Candida theae TaxID=1198502 RepID=A0AAD5B9E7_9ASCO|nr:uncharacterized protein KGF57_005211 [Candida theae]KAI5948813.1 hypothetical protein KGF57_005211 [Candida theae]